jgi:hypothetical protein
VAREALAGTLVGAAGELGVAHARRQEAADAVAEAAAAGRGLVQAAEAAALRDRAQAEVATADAGYAGAWQAARDAGWTPALLRGMGYSQPSAARPARRAATPAAVSDSSPAAAAS